MILSLVTSGCYKVAIGGGERGTKANNRVRSQSFSDKPYRKVKDLDLERGSLLPFCKCNPGGILEAQGVN